MSEKPLNFTNIILTQDNCQVSGNEIKYELSTPMTFSQMWLHQISFTNTLKNISALSQNNQIIVSVNGGAQSTILIEDGYYNADQLLNLIVNAFTSLGWNGSGFINGQYKYVLQP